MLDCRAGGGRLGRFEGEWKNLLCLNHDNVIKVIDFGIAKVVNDPEYTSLTMTGNVLGTPLYMAPEQVSDTKGVGPATDIFALGAVLYYCLTCRPPRQGKSMFDVIRALKKPPAPPSEIRGDVPPDLEAVVLKAMATDPGKRFASAQDVADALGG